MDLQSLSDAQTTDFAVDPTFQQLVSNSLIGLCCLVSVIGGGDIVNKWFFTHKEFWCYAIVVICL